MILQALDVDGRPVVVAATRVVILCDDGVTPVAAAAATPGGAVEVQQAADAAGRANPAFPRMLAAFGLDRSVVVGRAPVRRLDELAFR